MIRRSAGAIPEAVAVGVVNITPTRAFTAATTASARVIERNGRRIGYVHIWASHSADGLKAAMNALQPSRSGPGNRGGRQGRGPSESSEQKPPLDALVVDMRGRVGGLLSVAREYLDIIASGPGTYWGESHVIRGRTDQAKSPQPQNPSFRGRAALLTNHHARSAAEIMALGFKRSGFGPVIGTTTAGAVSSGRTFVMPGDMLLYVAVAGHNFDGKPLERVGVTPDIPVDRPLPYAAGADPVLDAAVEHLSRRELR